MLKKTLIGLMTAGAFALAAPAHADEAVVWSLTQQVEPGGQVQAVVFSEWEVGCTPSGPVTSRGFTAPLQWTEGGQWGRHAGYATAVQAPGKYLAVFPCTDGRTATGSFTVTQPPGGTLSASTLVETAKPQVTVGAPQTSGGSVN
ncbi:hypothetical protein [Amycolatopsis kentuckyensis]|uniref:hypothetical protein n=1 Tax=Amycolatopsis kentuckyensis TaxID=218823 RepID=UPI0035617395